MVWYSHLFKNFLQFVMVHIVKGFDIVNKEVDVFLELSCFFYDAMDVSNLIAGSSIHLEHLVVLGSCTVEAWLGEC